MVNQGPAGVWRVLIWTLLLTMRRMEDESSEQLETGDKSGRGEEGWRAMGVGCH